MSSVTVRIPEEKRDALKVIASVERRAIQDILCDLIDDYLERQKETLELLSNPEWAALIAAGKTEVESKVPGVSLDVLED